MGAADGTPRPPRRAPKRAHPHRTTLRWSNTDYSAVLAGAEQAGVTVGAYVRSRTLSAPTTRAHRRPSVEVVALAKLLGAVNRAGGNLHQLVRHANFGNLVFTEELKAAVASHRQVVDAIMAAMGRGP